MPSRRHLLLLSPILLLTLYAQAEIVERVVVKVNGEVLTLTEFQARQLRALQQARIAGDDVPTFLREHNARILQDAIDDLILKQRAAEEGLRVPPAYLAESIEEIKRENKITSDEQFGELLAREGMSLEDLKRDIETSITKEQIIRRDLEGKVTATDADAREDYEKSKEKYDRPATVTLHEILLKGDGAERRAQELARRARAGEDFAALAKEHSQAATRSQGGELGKVARGELNVEVEKAAFALPVDGVSEPVRTGDDWRIFKISEKTDAGVVPFDVAKEEIKRRLQVERFGKEYDAYMAEKRKAAVIDIRVREVPLHIDQTGRLVLDTSGSSSSPPLGTETPAMAPPTPAPDEEITTSGSAKPALSTPGAPASVTGPSSEGKATSSGPARPESSTPRTP